MSKQPVMGLEEFIPFCSKRLESIFTTNLSNVPSPDLKSAMEYTLFNGGKRLRPLLVYAAGYTFHAPWENLDLPACAIEMMHTYSLIHDDLPCMDNADLRRGKPACHKAYDEGMAVLTGDALQTLSLQIIANYPAPLKADRRLMMINALSVAAGPYGMAGGQALDITMMDDKDLPDDLLMEIYRLKTGVLFSACMELGRLASSDNDEINQQTMRQLGDSLGLAFQIQDDILDIESETRLSGKPQGIDARNHKNTYPARHGLPAAKDKVQSLYLDALETINYLGEQAQLLRDLIKHILR